MPKLERKQTKSSDVKIIAWGIAASLAVTVLALAIASALILGEKTGEQTAPWLCRGATFLGVFCGSSIAAALKGKGSLLISAAVGGGTALIIAALTISADYGNLAVSLNTPALVCIGAGILGGAIGLKKSKKRTKRRA